MVGIVEGEIGDPAEGSQLLTIMGLTMGFTDVFDQRNLALFQRTDELIRQTIESLDMGEKDFPGLVGELVDYLLSIHRLRCADRYRQIPG